MKIWLVTIGEPLPQATGRRDRLHRTGDFAHFLAERGHDVTWWTSAYDHFRKHFFGRDGEILRLTPNLDVRLLKSSGYRVNLSVARLRDHHKLARLFARAVTGEVAPDLIVSALPTIELCRESVRYARARAIPVVLDMRDMWPDIFVESVWTPVRSFVRLAIFPLLLQAREACAGATAIIGITEAFVDWGVVRAGRPRTRLDRAFPMGYNTFPPSPKEQAEAEEYWDNLGILAKSEFTVCFLGTIGRQFELEAVLEAARRLEASGRRMRFVLCGTGDRLEHYRARAAGLHSVLFPGWIGAAAIYVLMRRSSIGLDPLRERYDFLATINNKAIEYLSAGLPVISSPDRGVLRDMLVERGCGASVPSGNPEALAGLIASLYDDPVRRVGMSRNAQQTFESTYQAEVVYGEMLHHLEMVVAVQSKKKLPDEGSCQGGT